MNIENIERYTITLEQGQLFFYPTNQEMIFEYYDEKEDEDYEVLIWNKDGFQVVDVPFDKDTFLTIFKEFEEKNK